MARTQATLLQQSDEYAAALQCLGVRTTRQGAVLCLQRSLFGLPLTMVPRYAGPVPLDLWGAAFRGPVILSPDDPGPGLKEIGAVRVAAPVQMASLTLSADPDRMLAAMHGKWRNRLRHGQRQGLKVSATHMPPDPAHWLLQADVDQARVRGYRNWPIALTCAWVRANPRSSLLLEARDRDGVVAGMLFLRHGDGATYHIGVSTPRGQACSAHNLLLWDAMCRLGAKGVRELDLGRLHAAHPGLNRFKLGSGATVRCLGGSWIWWRPLAQVLAGGARRQAARSNGRSSFSGDGIQGIPTRKL